MLCGSEISVYVQEGRGKEGVSAQQGWHQVVHKLFHHAWSGVQVSTGFLHVLWGTLMFTLRRQQTHVQTNTGLQHSQWLFSRQVFLNHYSVIHTEQN